MNIFTLILIKFIKAYKYLISPLLGNSCRYLPTCSEYSIDALKEYGFFKGLLISIKSCLLYTSPSPRDAHESRMPSSA